MYNVYVVTGFVLVAGIVYLYYEAYEWVRAVIA